jgi:hypothetical protein
MRQIPRAIAIAVPHQDARSFNGFRSPHEKRPKIAANAAAVFPEHRHAQ